MITFNEFLTQYSEEIEEVYESVEMSRNAKKAVIFTMKKYLGNKKYDPLELMELFESVCYSSMSMGRVNRVGIQDRVHNEASTYLTEDDYSREPDITFEEVHERRSRGR